MVVNFLMSTVVNILVDIHIPSNTQRKNDSFYMTFKLAMAGDNQAMMEVIDFLLPDMEYLANFIKLPREESIQEMKAAMIEAIRQGEIQL
jgi:hypothetical protein